ncbi:MAG TPA: YjbH domain-containing protein [Bacteroidota bacterium]|nr:YjbH domain-containing protein [Bacteroidota bacterium]
MKTISDAPRLAAVLLVIAAGSRAGAQGSAGSSGRLEPRWLVDCPTAGMLPRGSMAFDAEFYRDGGVDLAFDVGIFDRLSAGLSYGGSSLIGESTPVMNATPGFNVRVRLLEESVYVPALALGFDSQGHDGYVRSLSRYTIKSPGFFAVLSKNYSALGYLSIHGGTNYSLERSDGNRNMNLFAGIEKTLGPFLSLMLEYNMGMNDAGGNSLGSGRGYLNAALRCSLGGGLTLGVSFKDLDDNGGNVTVANRTVHIEYVRPL